ncbi:MAG TPA: glycosyltransferase family 4 protein [Thermoanaerobaculia bacterium]|nr:glycosyltransferase family 4 protein [Thermoanaerobaculia bacterium]
MNLLILSRYGRRGASSRLRAFQYLPALERAGIRASVLPLFTDDYLEDLYAGRGRNWVRVCGSYMRRLVALRRARRFDLLWIEYELWPWLPGVLESQIVRAGVPYLVDYDDAIFHRYDFHRNPLVRALLGMKIDRILRRAAVVLAGNEYIAQRARRAGAPRVEVLPTVVDLERYKALPATRRTEVMIGWIGSPTTAPYLRMVEGALREACRDSRTRVVLVGSGPIELSGVPLTIRPWSEETEAAEIGEFDIGIMPLPDTPWERGKCGYKLIQYMACGKPVVASPVGVNPEIVREGANGFLAQTEGEWVKALAALRDDGAMRERLGSAGRVAVEERYCLQVAAPRLVAILQGAAAKRS